MMDSKDSTRKNLIDLLQKMKDGEDVVLTFKQKVEDEPAAI